MAKRTTIEYEPFRTKREAMAWMKDCQRRKPDKTYTVIPMSEVPEDRCIYSRAKGCRWAMRHIGTYETVRIPGLNTPR